MVLKIVKVKTTYDEKTRIWSGLVKERIYSPLASIGEEAVASMLRDPDHIAQISFDTGKQYTNKEIATLSIRIALNLKKAGAQQCDIVGLCATNTEFLAPLVFGALLSGLTLSTMDPSFIKEDIKHTLSITKPKMVFCDGSVYKTVKAAVDESNLKATIYTVADRVEGVPSVLDFLAETEEEKHYKPDPLKLGSAQTAFILCSSGTTGLPKGVCMAHESLLNNKIFDTEPTDKILCFSTLYWASGLISLLAGTLSGSTRVISARPFSPEDFFEMIEKYKVTAVFSPPSQVAMAVASPKIDDYDLSSLTTYICGGSAVPPSLVDKMTQHLPNATFAIGYGMSEVCGAVCYGEAQANGSVGQMAINCQLKIIDDAGQSLGPGETGEICIRTNYKWPGYYGNPEATAAIYQKDGWILSGDLGYVDQKGDVFIVDRKKDILKYRNFHFFPTEIENVILEMPEVAEVCVCGVPDIVSTDLPAAAIVKMPGSSLTQEAVYQHVASRMSQHKHLRGGVYFVDEIPKTASGKNLRRSVRTLCEKLYNADASANGQDSITQIKKEIRI